MSENQISRISRHSTPLLKFLNMEPDDAALGQSLNQGVQGERGETSPESPSRPLRPGGFADRRKALLPRPRHITPLDAVVEDLGSPDSPALSHPRQNSSVRDLAPPESALSHLSYIYPELITANLQTAVASPFRPSVPSLQAVLASGLRTPSTRSPQPTRPTPMHSKPQSRLLPGPCP